MELATRAAGAGGRSGQRCRPRCAGALPVARGVRRRARPPGIDERHLRETLRQELRMRAYLDQRFPAAGDRRPSSIFLPRNGHQGLQSGGGRDPPRERRWFPGYRLADYRPATVNSAGLAADTNTRVSSPSARSLTGGAGRSRPRTRQEVPWRSPRPHALQQMARAKRRARHDDAGDAAAEPPLEAMQQERALDFFAHAAGHHHHQGKQPGVARRPQQRLQRIVFHRVQPLWRDALDRGTTAMPMPNATRMSGRPAAGFRTRTGWRPRRTSAVARPCA